MSTVFYRRTHERGAFVHKILEIFREKTADRKKIFLKPNLVSHEDYPTTTHPETLRAVLEELADRTIIMGDAAAVDLMDAEEALRQHPLSQLGRDLGIPLVDLYQTTQVDRTSPRGYSLKISSLPLDCDYVISLPILKVHLLCDITGALKNQFGYLAKEERLRLHYRPDLPPEMKEGFQLLAQSLGINTPLESKDLAQGIAEVNAIAPAQLFIVDAVETLLQANEQRHGGTRAELGLLLAGTDPVALDCYGLKLLQEMEPKLKGKNPEDIDYLRLAIAYGLGSPEFQLVEV